MTQTTATVRLEAGRLLWKHIRNYVGDANASGANISIWEGDGFFERPFVLRGNIDTMRKVKYDLDRWIKEIEA